MSDDGRWLVFGVAAAFAVARTARGSRATALLPALTKRIVWHVGDLDQPRSRSFTSLEGRALSVSENPDAWTRIARLGGRPTFTLQRRDGKPGRFVNMLSLSRKKIEELILASQLAAPCDVYRLVGTDEEGEETYQVFGTREEAEREAYDEEQEIRRVRGWCASKELVDRWKSLFSSDLTASRVEDFALLEAIEALGLYDGVWWNEELAPELYSAPRGGLFQSKLPEWTVSRSGSKAIRLTSPKLSRSVPKVKLARPNVCKYCGQKIEDGRLESGWIYNSPDWMADHDFGCDGEGGAGDHVPLHVVRYQGDDEDGDE